MKKAQGLPINVVVMLIIGIVIFGLGMALFTKISGGAESEVEDLNNQIKNNIASLQCQGDNWICSPSNTISNGGKETFIVYIANKGETTADFSIDFALNSEGRIEKEGCGSIGLNYPPITTNIQSGTSASIPYIVRANRVSDTPCNFVTTATLTSSSGDGDGEKTSIIIRVQ
jgi:hypothetical protein